MVDDLTDEQWERAMNMFDPIFETRAEEDLKYQYYYDQCYASQGLLHSI